MFADEPLINRLGNLTADEASRKAGDGWGIVLNNQGEPVLVSIPAGGDADGN